MYVREEQYLCVARSRNLLHSSSCYYYFIVIIESWETQATHQIASGCAAVNAAFMYYRGRTNLPFPLPLGLIAVSF